MVNILYLTQHIKEKDLEEDVKDKILHLENECLQLKTKLSKIAQMNWWKRIVFIFKGCDL